MSKKLLLADDSITIQKVIQITFAHEDFDLTITDNGDAALAKAQEIKPDLVMADVYMPGKNGYELTSAIRQDPALQDTPVLLLAGSFEPFDEEKARDCRANAWIEKPFESQNLIDKVSELLSAAPSPASQPEPVTAPEPAPEAPPLADFDQPVSAEPEVAEVTEDSFGDLSFAEETPTYAPEPEAAEVTEDSFGDPSFAEEPPALAPEPSTAADDWSDVVAEPELVTPAIEEPTAQAEKAELDDFDMTEEEIMPLDEDDILEAEDLEPLPQEQTLAAWSRDAVPEEDISTDPADPMSAAEEEIFTAEEKVFVEEPPVTAAEPEAQEAESFAEPVTEVAPDFAAPAFETAPAEEAPAGDEEFKPAAVATTLGDVEEKASSLSEEEIEQVIEKVVTKVVEKLAGTILEKVAWEVVPDLAEHLIREEIRKIKDAAA